MITCRRREINDFKQLIEEMKKYKVVKNFNKCAELNEWSDDFKNHPNNLKKLVTSLLKTFSESRDLNIKCLKEIIKLKEQIK
jgi:hypothetical protein